MDKAELKTNIARNLELAFGDAMLDRTGKRAVRRLVDAPWVT